jgi:hypothetical protein
VRAEIFMFLIRWIRGLLAIPFSWAGQLAAMFKLSLEVPLLRTAANISGSGKSRQAAVMAVRRQQGVAPAALLAQSWMRSRPSPEVAAFAGLLALETGDVELAKTCLQQGRQLGTEEAGMLEMLEFFLVGRTEPPEKMIQFAQQLSERSDLPARVSKLVLIEVLWVDMLQKRWEAAAAKADRLLAVANTPEAEAALWAMACQRGNERAAEDHLSRVTLPTVQRAHWLCLGSAAIGERERARGYLEEVRQNDAAMAQRAEAWLRTMEVAI